MKNYRPIGSDRDQTDRIMRLGERCRRRARVSLTERGIDLGEDHSRNNGHGVGEMDVMDGWNGEVEERNESE